MSKLKEQDHVRVTMDLGIFGALVSLLQNGKNPNTERIRLQDELISYYEGSGIQDLSRQWVEANEIMRREDGIGERRRFRDGDMVDDPRSGEDKKCDGFIYVGAELMYAVDSAFTAVSDLIDDLVQPSLIVGRGPIGENLDSAELIQQFVLQFQLNQGPIERHVNAILQTGEVCGLLGASAKLMAKTMERYYEALNHRHTVEGVKIYQNPVVTDVAMLIYNNIDPNGEIESGKSVKEISRYTIRKAERIADIVAGGDIASFIRDPVSMLMRVQGAMFTLAGIVEGLSNLYKGRRAEIAKLFRKRNVKESDLEAFRSDHSKLTEMNVMDIAAKDKTVLLSSQERFSLNFKNETLKTLSSLLMSGSAHSVVSFVLDRKEELRKYFQDENSFYVCKIGQGSPFGGEAPGALTVIPGQKPNVNLDEILGSGFAEVKSFVTHIEDAAQWHDLYVATSPSKTADKSNVLLVGPMGCGKSQILRSVGGDKKSIGIFAQGSDFLTCWKGEAEKNPKRLFEAGMKLQKASGKHVHFLIDEIDSVLKKDKGYGESDLTLEFQILMDGVVHYPNLSVWGATNNPERIPMPMIRRFSKVLIVGELDQLDRVKLLKLYTGFMPIGDISEMDWDGFSTRLEGATGDIIRKVADQIWREKMSWFVQNHRDGATKLAKMLNRNGKFSISEFDSTHRREFRAELGKFFQIDGIDIERSIDWHLKNFAIIHEIQTAKETYQQAKRFLATVNATQTA